MPVPRAAQPKPARLQRACPPRPRPAPRRPCLPGTPCPPPTRRLRAGRRGRRWLRPPCAGQQAHRRSHERTSAAPDRTSRHCPDAPPTARPRPCSPISPAGSPLQQRRPCSQGVVSCRFDGRDLGRVPPGRSRSRSNGTSPQPTAAVWRLAVPHRHFRRYPYRPGRVGNRAAERPRVPAGQGGPIRTRHMRGAAGRTGPNRRPSRPWRECSHSRLADHSSTDHPGGVAPWNT